MLIVPWLYPSQYLAAPVFLGFAFLLDPLNASAGAESILGDAREGRYGRLINLLIAGLICGVAWEFFNYWAGAKWKYTVPILPELRIFEMPLLGYGGFPGVRGRVLHDVRGRQGTNLAGRGAPHLGIIRGSARLRPTLRASARSAGALRA